MAYIPMTIGKKTSDVITKLGGDTASTATTINITISDLGDYTHVIFTSNITNTPLISNSSTGIVAIVPVDYFKQNAITGTYNTGSSGSGQYQSVTFTYINDTTVRVTRTNTTSRTFSVFGIT